MADVFKGRYPDYEMLGEEQHLRRTFWGAKKGRRLYREAAVSGPHCVECGHVFEKDEDERILLRIPWAPVPDHFFDDEDCVKAWLIRAYPQRHPQQDEKVQEEVPA